jgi:hypothetical protein
MICNICRRACICDDGMAAATWRRSIIRHRAVWDAIAFVNLLLLICAEYYLTIKRIVMMNGNTTKNILSHRSADIVTLFSPFANHIADP